MEVTQITDLIEKLAPLELQESWDCSGLQIDVKKDIKKILLCLSVRENIVDQAIEQNCDMIISHHPLFLIPFNFKKNIPIYSAHTNLDKADGGTTDTLIELLGLSSQKTGDFLRSTELKEEILLDDFIQLLKEKLALRNIRVVNNFSKKKIKKIAFCAGGGMDFLKEAVQNATDVFVTGDVKYHMALESGVIIIDIGHFESEWPVLKTLKNILKPLDIEVVIADEKSPFINY